MADSSTGLAEQAYPTDLDGVAIEIAALLLVVGSLFANRFLANRPLADRFSSQRYRLPATGYRLPLAFLISSVSAGTT
jgi:hypothetical protein